MNYLKAISTAVEAAGLLGNGAKYLVDNSEDIAKSLKSLSMMLDAAKGLMDRAADIVPIDELLNQAETGEAAQLGEATRPGDPAPHKASPANKPQLKTPGLSVPRAEWDRNLRAECPTAGRPRPAQGIARKQTAAQDPRAECPAARVGQKPPG